MRPNNVLVILDDEHQRGILGCYGDRFARTPNLDALAARGAIFTDAYTPSPICVPARASLHTGLHVHQVGAWDSAEPYRGDIRSWAHRLRDAGREVVSVGKLHFRSTKDDNGFTREVEPLHVKDGIGWARAVLRRDPPVSLDCYDYCVEVGAGETSYTNYDRRIAKAAAAEIRAAAKKEEPFAFFVSFVSPHFPLITPEPFLKLYDNVDLPPAPLWRAQGARHPVIERLVEALPYDERFTPERAMAARRAYYGLVSFVDDCIGEVLRAVDDSGQRESTTVVFSSDHGDSLGGHSLWAKSTMYEHSAGVPMLVAGPGVPAGRRVTTPASLIDVYPTVLQAAGLKPDAEEEALPGRSLVEMAQAADAPERPAFSEYHDGGSVTGFFLLRLGRWKYVHYVGHPPELFDLAADPLESRDLGQDPAYARERAACEAALREIVDPEAANAAAFRDQAAAIERMGGEAKVLGIADFGYTPLAGAAD